MFNGRLGFIAFADVSEYFFALIDGANGKKLRAKENFSCRNDRN
jgi:hypothetical protein